MCRERAKPDVQSATWLVNAPVFETQPTDSLKLAGINRVACFCRLNPYFRGLRHHGLSM